MKNVKILTILVLAIVIVSWAKVSEAAPLGNAFTYQGRLIDNNQPADGLYDLQFKLFDASSDGNQLWGDVNTPEVDVIDGYFTVELDFGSVFDGNERWLEIGVRPGELGDPNLYTSLSPRQLIAPAPYALYAKTTGGGADSDWIISGNDMYSGVSGNVGIGTTSPVAKLDVSGDINVASAYKIGGSTVLSIPGTDNTFTGFGAGSMNTTGHYNTFSGYGAGFWNTGGNSNTFIGQLAGQSNGTGNSNTFLGTRSGFSNTTGYGNTFSGYYAGYNNTTGYDNTFSGINAGYSNTTGNDNTFSGIQAGGQNTTGNYNTFSGMSAGYNNTTGSYNTFSGMNAGVSNTTGGGNVFLGYQAGYYATGSNKLYIANSSADANVLIYGDFSTGRVGISLTNPTEALDVDGTARLRGIGAGNWTTVVVDANGKLWKQSSSQRYKKNIETLDTGADAVFKLRPVSFEYKESGQKDIGLIAEEVEKISPDLVIYDGEGRPDAVKYDKVALYLLSVVKNQQVEKDVAIESLKKENEDIKARLVAMESLVSKLSQQEGGMK